MKLYRSTLSFFALILSSPLFGATPIPSFDGQPGSTRASYYFRNDSTSPDYDSLAFINPFGFPVATIVPEETLGTGWQEPVGNSNDLDGATQDGAWDLGPYVADDGTGNPKGYIEVSVPVALGVAPLEGYEVEFLIYSIGYADGLIVLPELEIEGGVVEDLASNETNEAPEPPFGNWVGKTWTGRITNVTTPEVVFRIEVPDSAFSQPSVVDSFEIFTNTNLVIIPEPSSALLIMSALAFSLAGVRRR